MPTASDELRDTMRRHFGNNGVDHYEPYKFLMDNGWKDEGGMLRKPDKPLTGKEWDCVQFLCDEWDFGYLGQ